MSHEATGWALSLAPIPKDPSGRPNSACAFVLVGLADHADPEGRNAFPSVDTLCLYTRLSERTVRTALDRLEEDGVIRACNPAVVAATIGRGDRRPRGYDLALARVRDDLTEQQVARLGRRYPGLATRVEASRNGVQSPHPVVSEVQLTPERGATDATAHAQRGATVAPEPKNHPEEPPSLVAVTGDNTSTASRRTRIGPGWAPSPALLAWAADRCPTVDAQAQVEPFVDHHLAKGTVMADWSRAFQTWVRNAPKFAGPVRQQRMTPAEIAAVEW